MQKIMAANWKMFKTRQQARETVTQLHTLLAAPLVDRMVLIFPPFTCLAETAEAGGHTSELAVGGQDVYPATEGAFTGEISPAMLLDAGAAWVLAGHSERRQILGESLDFISKKVSFSLQQGLNALLCVGESLEEREQGHLEQVLDTQLKSALAGLNIPQGRTLAVAYEPVWAIGTGKVAGVAEILEAHAIIRRLLVEIFAENGHDIAILYGGSVKPDNAAAIMALDNVDGVLVGGASLQAESFARIITA